MARITVEDCLDREQNRFSLVLLAAKRTKQILRGSPVRLKEQKANKAVVTALREIAAGEVRFMSTEEAEQARLEAEERRQKRLAELASQPRSSTLDIPLPLVDDTEAPAAAQAAGESSNGASHKAKAKDDEDDDLDVNAEVDATESDDSDDDEEESSDEPEEAKKIENE